MEKMEPIERYKALKQFEKIIDFFEKDPEISLMFKYETYRKIISFTILDFQLGKKKDFRYYPWLKKIKEKRKEMYGV